MGSQVNSTFGNRIIDRLLPDDLQRLRPHLVLMHRRAGDVICDAGRPFEHVFFPTTCVISAVTVMVDGNMIEVAATGAEGIIGHAVAKRDRIAINRVIVSIAGGSLRIGADAFHHVLSHSSAMQEVIARHNSAVHLQLTRSVACNGMHKLEMRCCRWLLMIRDSIGSSEIPITHEFLSGILGVRRASISETLAPLQAAGLLTLDRGVITLRDPAGVELRACECYHVVRNGYRRLMRPE